MAKAKKKYVKPQGKVTPAEALAMANALADALGFPPDDQQDQGAKSTKIAP